MMGIVVTIATEHGLDTLSIWKPHILSIMLLNKQSNGAGITSVDYMESPITFPPRLWCTMWLNVNVKWLS